MDVLPLAEACLRNQEPIANCLQSLLKDSTSVLEIGSGTGQHAVFICRQMPHLQWQPTELEERVQDVEAWRKHEQLANVLETKVLDVLQDDWHLENSYDAVFSANTVHFISWKKVDALLKGASEHLKSGGHFIVYGPYNKNRQFTSDGNRKLDAWLKQRDPESGIKDKQEFLEHASSYGLDFIEEHTMPANNIILHFRKYLEHR